MMRLETGGRLERIRPPNIESAVTKLCAINFEVYLQTADCSLNHFAQREKRSSSKSADDDN